jgi:hypothetical protein
MGLVGGLVFPLRNRPTADRRPGSHQLRRFSLKVILRSGWNTQAGVSFRSGEHEIQVVRPSSNRGVQ